MSPTPKSVLDERVTEEAVRWAYRLVLGREPENDEIVREHCLKTTSLLHLHEAFVGSAELRKRVAGVAPPQPTGLEPRLAIDKAETPELRQRLLDHIARSWTHLGETEPHWSVLTEDQFLSGTLDANLAAFHASGESNVQRFLATVARAGVELDPNGHCVELGCGVGRLTRWLAPHFARVTGIDVSPAHITLARSHVARYPGHVDFLQLRRLDDLDRLPPAQAFFSFIVLQHNPPPVMEAILERIFNRLDSGAIAYFELPTYIPGYQFDVREYLRQHESSVDMEIHALPQAAVYDIADRSGMRLLEALGETTRDLIVSHYFLMQKR